MSALETAAEVHAQHRACLREMRELTMDLIRQTGQAALGRGIEAGDGEPAPRAPSADTMFHRLCHSLRQIITLECRLVGTESAGLRIPPPDDRRPLLRECLRRCVDPALQSRTQAQLHRDIDRWIEVKLATDPLRQVPIGEFIADIADTMEMPVNWKRIPTLALDFYQNFCDPNDPDPSPARQARVPGIDDPEDTAPPPEPPPPPDAAPPPALPRRPLRRAHTILGESCDEPETDLDRLWTTPLDRPEDFPRPGDESG